VSVSGSRPNLEQARKQAKDLLGHARSGDPAALARLMRRHDPLQLADAQYAVASELGFTSWPELVRALDVDVARFEAVARDAIDRAIDSGRVERLTLVPFLPDGSLVLVDDAGRLRVPSDALLPGEHPLADAPLRIALEAAGFRRQGTHPFAAAGDARHVGMWIDGARYDGARPHQRDARWWTGPAETAEVALRAQRVPNTAALVRMADAARVNLTDDEYWADSQRVLDAAYLAAGTAEGGSGFGGSVQDWHDERSVLLDAIDRDGSFLDVGCANGLLMESLVRWSDARSVRLEPYGLDISEPLAALARRRLPQWADRIWVGNALEWMPPNGRQFDYVHTLLETVPAHRHDDLIRHLLATAVAPGGRLLVSHYGVEQDRKAAAILARLGYAVAGETRAPDRQDGRRRPPSAWIDKSSGRSRPDR
jgi:SAM-dependent methyltransferase